MDLSRIFGILAYILLLSIHSSESVQDQIANSNSTLKQNNGKLKFLKNYLKKFFF